MGSYSKIGIYAGSFDPLTLGHLDIISRSFVFCNHLIIAVGCNPDKKPMFNEDDRIQFIRNSLSSTDRHVTTVLPFGGLLVDFANYHCASILVRGIRSSSDFEYEMNLAAINRGLAPDIETVFLPTKPELSMISSSAAKEIAKHHGNLEKFVPSSVAQALRDKFTKE